MHWAGPIGATGATVELLLLGLFLVLATIPFEALFRHLDLSYPTIRLEALLMILVYLPTFLGAVILIFSIALELNQAYLLQIYSVGMIYGTLDRLLRLYKLLTKRCINIGSRAGIASPSLC